MLKIMLNKILRVNGPDEIIRNIIYVIFFIHICFLLLMNVRCHGGSPGGRQSRCCLVCVLLCTLCTRGRGQCMILARYDI